MPLFFLSIIVALIAAFIASNKGRNALGWFILCLITSPFGLNIVFLIVLLILSDLNEIRGRHAVEAAWRRRHQESFDQERSLNRNFREHVIKRLDRQDEAIGLPPMDVEKPIDIPPAPKEIVTYPMMGNGEWYLVINGKEQGPYPENEVITMLDNGKVSRDTYAWSEGMKDWVRANNIGNFSAHG